MKRSQIAFLVLIPLMVILLIFIGCAPQTIQYVYVTATIIPTRGITPSATNKPTKTPDKRTDFEKCEQSGEGVRYVISGTGVSAVSLTWENDTNGTEQGDYLIPFCKIYRKFNPGDFLYISAQIIEGEGKISCLIYDGTQVIAKGNASGFAAIASCDGSK